VLRTELVAASIVPILFNSVLSPRYSVLMSFVSNQTGSFSGQRRRRTPNL
jgi:hypothetical protein